MKLCCFFLTHLSHKHKFLTFLQQKSGPSQVIQPLRRKFLFFFISYTIYARLLCSIDEHSFFCVWTIEMWITIRTCSFPLFVQYNDDSIGFPSFHIFSFFLYLWLFSPSLKNIYHTHNTRSRIRTKNGNWFNFIYTRNALDSDYSPLYKI